MLCENKFNVLYAIKKYGNIADEKLAAYVNLPLEKIQKIKGKLNEESLIDAKGITAKGLSELAPYKVDNALIMAAGMASRFLPLSLELPKGLLKVKGEILIERQIIQLKEAGINDITIVLGYKKESFFYLEKKFGVKLIINPEFHTKNNTYTLFLARNELRNTYICSSDDYFVKNVFEEYVYESYYASVHAVDSDEWYMSKDENNHITKVVKKGKGEGDVMLGHVYWNKEFSKAIMKIISDAQEDGHYDDSLWEGVLLDHVSELPPMQVKTYPSDIIFEFDSLAELREFDDKFIKHSSSKIMENICQVLKCEENEIINFKAINAGLTNTSFIFEVRGNKYVYRHPGDGTSAIISRQHEKKSLELAKKAGIDPTYIYMNAEEGWKISHYVEGVRTPDYKNFGDSKRVIEVMRNLHEKNLHVDWSFKPFEDALDIEKLILQKNTIDIPDYYEIKDRIIKLFNKVNGDGVEKRWCHCDTYAPNWMLTDKQTILIDWEYSGESDPGSDLAAYIMDAMYSIEESEKFIAEYLGKEDSEKLRFHYLAYVAIVSYYWFVWAIYREACGAIMGDSLHNWYVMARDYSEYLVKKHNL